MRPTSRRESVLRSPLNDILGTEANVRLLRVLSRTQLPMTATELARQAAITLSGVGRALGALERTGIIEFVGVGSRRPVQLRRAHPLVPALEALFSAEEQRVDTIFARIRAAAELLVPAPWSIWVEGPVARGTDGPGDPVVVGVLAGAKELD
ncbi:MAG TPA: winged helix-turn-helix domain-containing protein, partial [Gemmatimonadaceae bacterium]|nr:winged helix-turn-helix domain-containing protein [Gemmatimonadaceae bacterium]